MGQHTPEPWHRDGMHINAGLSSQIGTAYTVAGVASNVNADRIVDCVNALAGISDPAAWVKAARDLLDAADSTDGNAELGKAMRAFRAADRPVPAPGAGGEKE